MVSGFDKVAKCLYRCPHPTLYASYIRYLQPLLEPWADITLHPSNSQNSSHTPNDHDNTHNSHDDNDDDQWTDDDDDDDDDQLQDHSYNNNHML